MSYIYLQDQGGASLADCFEDIPPSVLSRLIHTAKKFSCRDNVMASYPDFQSGMTSGTLTEPHGRESLTSFQADSHAKTSVQQEKARGSLANDLDYGPKWQGSFARYNPNTFLWKTRQGSLFGGLEEFSGTWPRWGTMLHGECWERKTPFGVMEVRATITSVSVSGSLRLPTPKASDGKRGDCPSERARNTPCLPSAIKRLPTQTANDAEKRGNFDIMNPRNGLPAAILRLRTPCASDADHWNLKTAEERKAKGSSIRLPNQLQAGGKQSPMWTEWFMGFPIGWTDLEPLATHKFQQWFRSFSDTSYNFPQPTNYNHSS
jgi:hypothetical protein